MARPRAVIKQADVARAVRAAKQAGAGAVEIRPDGTILVLIEAPPSAGGAQSSVEDEPEVVM
jgi:hypothetical protein